MDTENFSGAKVIFTDISDFRYKIRLQNFVNEAFSISNPLPNYIPGIQHCNTTAAFIVNKNL